MYSLSQLQKQQIGLRLPVYLVDYLYQNMWEKSHKTNYLMALYIASF